MAVLLLVTAILRSHLERLPLEAVVVVTAIVPFRDVITTIFAVIIIHPDQVRKQRPVARQAKRKRMPKGMQNPVHHIPQMFESKN